MESHKNKVLRITRNIFNIVPDKIVEITDNDNEIYTFKCKCYDNNYDLYDLNNKNISWGLSCDTLDETRQLDDSELLEEANDMLNRTKSYYDK